MVGGKSAGDWPIHKFDNDHPWKEDEKYSVLPNNISQEVGEFWGVDPVGKDDLGYLLNITGKAYGLFERKKTDLKRYGFELPEYLKQYYESLNQGVESQRDEALDGKPGNAKDGNKSDNDAPDGMPKAGDISFDGKLSFSFKSLGYNYNNPDLAKFVKTPEDRVDDAVLVKVKIGILDLEEAVHSDLDTYGVYFQNTGAIVSITNSAKFVGNYALPQFTMNEDNYKKAQKLMNQFLNGTNVEKQVSMDDMNIFISRSLEQCEYITYVQLEKTEYSLQELRDIDEELANPSGKPITKNPPKIRVKHSLMYSPDCGIVLNNMPKSVFEGEKTEIVMAQLRRMLIGFIVLIGLQLYLFMNQIKISKTPGQLSNISSVTLMFLQYEDSLVALCFLLISTFYDTLYLLLACISMVTYIMCGVFEVGFLTQVMKTQLNERGTTWWEILRNSRAQTELAPAPEPAPAAGELPRPVTDPNGGTGQTPATGAAAAAPGAGTTGNPEFANLDTSVWNSIFAPGFAVTIISSFLILNSTMWRRRYRVIFEVIGVTLINSYWIPQFLRNTLKNRRVPFTWTFILGTSTIRLIPIIYLNLFKNPLRHEKNGGFVVFIVCWVSFQLILLYLQSLLSPRFWINEDWLPKAYNYHPVIDLKDLEQGYGTDLLANINVNEVDQAGKSSEVIKCHTECAICMTSVELPIHKDNKPKKGGSKEYMITPCFHIFHTECLEDWMKYKLQCPVCRNLLPPV